MEGGCDSAHTEHIGVQPYGFLWNTNLNKSKLWGTVRDLLFIS